MLIKVNKEMSSHFKQNKNEKKKRHHIIKRATNELRNPPLRKMHVLT